MNRGTLINCVDTIDEYVSGTDWRVKANSNASYSNASMINNTSGKVIANYWLDNVYSEEESAAHRNGDYHIHDLDCLTAYCGGWSLRDLLNEGFNGVRGRVNSRPPKHLRSALSQMANFLGILQNEWAGAQAFTSFDTLLAPYVFKDNLEYNEVEEAIRSFVYNLNVPSRWGQCVPETYKLLLPDGSWVGVHDLKLGDSIMVFDIENETLKEDILTHITFKDAPAKMHRYKAIYSDKVFEVTPDHRVIYADVDGMEPLSIATSQKLLQDKSSVLIPVSATVVEEFTITEVDGSCNKVWCPTTNTGTFVCMTDRGHVFLTGNCPFTNITFDWTVPNDLKYLQPLCNSLPLFSDIDSLELLQKAQERGVESLEELTYEHMLPEMQIIQKAYYKVMTEGDSTGQPFTFPIPTINITEDFDWESDSADALFENAAKVGSSYFQNFVGTQYKLDEAGNKVIDENAFKPSDLRSMCPLDYNEKIVVRDQHDAIYAPIGEVYQRHVNGVKYKCFYNGEWIPAKVIEVNPQKLYHITLANNSTYKMGAEHEQPILRDGKTMIIPAKEIVAGDLIPFNSTAIDAGMVNSSYALGYAVGAYLNDGSKDKDGIIYSIDEDITENTLKTFWEGLGYRVTITYNDNRRSLHVGVGAGSFDIIAKYFTGKSAQDRTIAPNILSQSIDMRKGLIDGYIATAGECNDSRVWASSHVMVEDLIAVFNSIGIKAYCSFTDTRDGNHYYAISYIKDRENCDGKYTTVDGQLYWTVTDVQVKDNTKPLYCLVTDSDHHLFILKDGLITHNCRLRLNLKEIRKRGNGLFGSGEATGSIGVVTINLARIGYMYRGDKEGLYNHLFKLMDMASSTLTKKRKIVNELYERGMYPYTKRYLKAGFSNHFSTIGVNGANEMVRNFTNDEHDISDEWGKAFCIELLQRMNERIVQYQEDTGNLYNLEASPAESACYRFAREDAARFPGIIQAGTCDQNYYTNSTQLNSGHTADMFIALKHQNELQPLYSGGVVFHLYMGEAVSSPDACKWMMKKIMENFRLPYVTVTPTFSVCEKHGYIKGNHEYCPYCDEEALTQVKSSCACHH